MSTSQGMDGTDRADPSDWPTVAWPMLTNRQRELFRAREEAVRCYCRREPRRVIAAATGVPFNSIRRLYERCLQTHADGRMQGFRALVPYERVKPYRRLAKIGRPGIAGKAGVFAQLLQRHPDLEALIVSELQEQRVVDLGSSKVQGPITCPGCAEPLLPVTRGGYPTTGSITAGEFSLIARWLAFIRRRAAQPAWRNGSVLVDTRRPVLDASTCTSLQAIKPAGAVRRPATRIHVRWTDDAEYPELEQYYWRRPMRAGANVMSDHASGTGAC